VLRSAGHFCGFESKKRRKKRRQFDRKFDRTFDRKFDSEFDRSSTGISIGRSSGDGQLMTGSVNGWSSGIAETDLW
jgi:hypothetical protein